MSNSAQAPAFIPARASSRRGWERRQAGRAWRQSPAPFRAPTTCCAPSESAPPSFSSAGSKRANMKHTPLVGEFVGMGEKDALNEIDPKPAKTPFPVVQIHRVSSSLQSVKNRLSVPTMSVSSACRFRWHDAIQFSRPLRRSQSIILDYCFLSPVTMHFLLHISRTFFNPASLPNSAPSIMTLSRKRRPIVSPSARITHSIHLLQQSTIGGSHA